MAVALFITAHWFVSLFMQTFFLHRYAAHKMFFLNRFWERFFHLLTFVSQGSSYLNPRAYAILHRMHHAYSDTPKDPHSPHFSRHIAGMMVKTYRIYMDYLKRRVEPEKAFDAAVPEWPFIERLADTWIIRILWGILYFIVYYLIVPEGGEWMYVFLPLHFVMGPVHGAIVNWSGHKYGYQNYDNHDKSRNTFFWDFFLLGELFQNNHHKDPNNPDFARKWFEIDPGYWIVRGLHFLKIITLRKRQIV